VIVDFIREHKDRRDGGLRWGVEPICAVLGQYGVKIAPSTYYEWLDKLPTAGEERDQELMTHILRVSAENYRVYGARKIWLVLNREGIPVARCTVERLMKALGVQGVHRGRRVRTTIPRPGDELPGDLVNRCFKPVAPNRLWVADFTYVSTWSGWSYTAFVIDAYARRILGWAVSATMTSDLVIDALEHAVWTRDRDGRDDLTAVVGHHDHGSQYTSLRYSQHLSDAGITASTGTVGDSFDNALAETINGLYKTELIKPRRPWKTIDDVEYATAEWVDWFHHRRINQYCHDLAPVEYENLYYALHNDTEIPTPVPQ